MQATVAAGDLLPTARRKRGRAVVLGASVAGASATLQLARRGWHVTVVDPDLNRFHHAAQVPSLRPGAPHTVQGHGWMARTTTELRDRLPDVYDGVLAEGAHELSFAERTPAFLVDGGRPADDDLTMLQMRRLVLDRVLWQTLAREPRVILSQARAVGLLLDGEKPQRVRGVTLDTGATARGDVVLDCTGRRTKISSWLADHGILEGIDERDCGASYYGRHYRVGPGARPPLNAGFAQVNGYPRVTNLWFPGDADHAMLALVVHEQDPCLKTLRRPDAFEAVAHANPELATWLRLSEPTTEVFSMGSLRNRLRRTVTGSSPLVLGLHHVGDSLANSNPTRGRGVSMALASVTVVVDLLTEHPHDLHAQAVRYDAWVRGPLGVYWREASASDQAASDRLLAGVKGQVTPATAPAVELGGATFSSMDLERAASRHPDLLRALMRAGHLLDDSRNVASPDTAHLVRTTLTSAPAPSSPTGPVTKVPSSLGSPLEDPAHLETLLAPYAT